MIRGKFSFIFLVTKLFQARTMKLKMLTYFYKYEKEAMFSTCAVIFSFYSKSQ